MNHIQYKAIENAIAFAIDEVRKARYEANERLETDIKVFKKLDEIQTCLAEAISAIYYD